MRNGFLTFTLAATLIASASPVLAGGGVGGDWEIGGYGGYGWLNEYGTLEPKDNVLFGARLGYFFTPAWSLELSAQRLPTEMSAFPDRKLKFDSGRLNGFYNLAPGSRLRPYITAGVGMEAVGNDFLDERSSDLGWNAGGGLRFFLTPNWSLRADGRWMQVRVDELDESESNGEATVGISALFGGGGEKPSKPEPTPAPTNAQPQVSCVPDRSDVLPGESVRVSATASDPEGDPMTYEWTTSAGRVSGTGSTAMLDMSGAAPATAATVTVRVTDNHGNTATCESSVNVVEPVRQAESISCMAGGFPRGAARLTNVDKACLDDVAQRLKADPRAKVIVIGHADPHESSANRVGKQRADAVEDYLEQTGIDHSRITTRSAGSTHVLDSGAEMTAQSRNRRVEVWFVPEGAKGPEE